MTQKDLVSFEEFRPMIESAENGLFQWLDKGYKAIKCGLDTDKVIVICGKERKGKTTLVLRTSYKLNPNFNIENICFKGKQFRIKSKKLEKDILIIDEGGNVLYSGDTMSKDSKKTIKRIMEMGYKNNIVFILIPNYFKLDKDIRTRRVGALIRITNKGRFYTYDESSAIKIGIAKDWKAAKPLTSGYWNHTEETKEFKELWKNYKLREKHFKDKKDDEDGDDEDDEENVKKVDVPKELKRQIIKKLFLGGMTQVKIAEVVGYTRKTVSKIINEE